MYLVYLLNVLISISATVFVVGVNEGRRKLATAAAVVLFLVFFVPHYIMRGSALSEVVSFVGMSSADLQVRDLDVYILSVDTPVAKCRRNPLQTQLERFGLPYKVVLGTSYRDHNTTQSMINAAGLKGLEDGELYDEYRSKFHITYPKSIVELVTLLTARKILIDALASNTGQKYVLVLEDDAELTVDFPSRLARAIRRFKGYDLVWLDTRNIMSWAVLGKPAAGSVGMLFDVKLLPRSIKEMSLTSETSLALLKNGQQPLFDVGLMKACWMKKITCACAPLVREQKVKSSIDYKYKPGR